MKKYSKSSAFGVIDRQKENVRRKPGGKKESNRGKRKSLDGQNFTVKKSSKRGKLI